MSGHSKWSTIKHKKGALDAKRGKLFSQLSKNIRVAVKEGKSGDVNMNPGLRLAVDKAKAANMPNENVQRAIDRALGVGKGGRVEEILYEGYGPGGVGFLVVAFTDNKMRTGSELRTLFEKNGGSLAGPGSVSFMFQRGGGEAGYILQIPIPVSEETVRAKVEELEELLHEHDDVEEVFYNMES